MNVGATAEQPHLMRRLSRGLGNTKLGTSQEDNDDDNDEDDVNNPMALMRKVLSGHARSMFAIQSDSGMMEEGRRRRRRRRKGAPAPPPPPVSFPSDWEKRSGRSCLSLLHHGKEVTKWGIEEAVKYCKDRGKDCQGIFAWMCDLRKGLSFSFCRNYNQDGPRLHSFNKGCVYQHESHIK